MIDTLWRAILDDRFECKVDRVEPFWGRLELVDMRDARLVLWRKVPLHMDARFGPDVQDVETWFAVCQDAVDNLPEEDR